MSTLLDIRDMPGFNPKAATADFENDVSVTSGRVHLVDGLPQCVEHRAMLCVSENRTLWRCIACGAGAYFEH